MNWKDVDLAFAILAILAIIGLLGYGGAVVVVFIARLVKMFAGI